MSNQHEAFAREPGDVISEGKMWINGASEVKVRYTELLGRCEEDLGILLIWSRRTWIIDLVSLC